MPGDLFHSLLQVAVIVLAARCFGRLAKIGGQPQVVGEMFAGVILGPSLLGWVVPEAFRFLFASSPSLPLSILGLILPRSQDS